MRFCQLRACFTFLHAYIQDTSATEANEHARNISDAHIYTFIYIYSLRFCNMLSIWNYMRMRSEPLSRRALTFATSAILPLSQIENAINRAVLLRLRASHATVLLSRLSSLIFIAIHVCTFPHDGSVDRGSAGSWGVAFLFASTFAMHERGGTRDKFCG